MSQRKPPTAKQSLPVKDPEQFDAADVEEEEEDDEGYTRFTTEDTQESQIDEETETESKCYFILNNNCSVSKKYPSTV